MKIKCEKLFAQKFSRFIGHKNNSPNHRNLSLFEMKFQESAKMFKITLTVLVFFLAQYVLTEEVTPSVDNAVYDSYRLPTSVRPENYKLEVITHLNDTEGFLFRGAVWITVS